MYTDSAQVVGPKNKFLSVFPWVALFGLGCFIFSVTFEMARNYIDWTNFDWSFFAKRITLSSLYFWVLPCVTFSLFLTSGGLRFFLKKMFLMILSLTLITVVLVVLWKTTFLEVPSLDVRRLIYDGFAIILVSVILAFVFRVFFRLYRKATLAIVCIISVVLIVCIFVMLILNNTKSYARCASMSHEDIFCHLDLIGENLSKNPDNQLLVCEQIEVPGNHLKAREYKNECYLMVSRESSSVNVCSQIQDNLVYQDGCITNVARATKNPTICESIEDVSYRDFCKYESR